MVDSLLIYSQDFFCAFHYYQILSSLDIDNPTLSVTGTISLVIGSTLTLKCYPKASLPFISYKWFKDYQELPSVTTSSLILTSLRMESVGRYHCLTQLAGIVKASLNGVYLTVASKLQELSELNFYYIIGNFD